MKTRGMFFVMIGSLLLGTVGVAQAADTPPSRADQVAAIQAKYNPIFDAEYVRLMAVKAKIGNDETAMASFQKILDDFLQVRSTIDENLRSATADLEPVAAYAEEETGEFADTLLLLEKQFASPKPTVKPTPKVTPKKVVMKTIFCTKGKTVKKVTAVKPVCPKGYVKK